MNSSLSDRMLAAWRRFRCWRSSSSASRPRPAGCASPAATRRAAHQCMRRGMRHMCTSAERVSARVRRACGGEDEGARLRLRSGARRERRASDGRAAVAGGADAAGGRAIQIQRRHDGFQSLLKVSTDVTRLRLCRGAVAHQARPLSQAAALQTRVLHGARMVALVSRAHRAEDLLQLVFEQLQLLHVSVLQCTRGCIVRAQLKANGGARMCAACAHAQARDATAAVGRPLVARDAATVWRRDSRIRLASQLRRRRAPLPPPARAPGRSPAPGRCPSRTARAPPRRWPAPRRASRACSYLHTLTGGAARGRETGRAARRVAPHLVHARRQLGALQVDCADGGAVGGAHLYAHSSQS